ncbi:MAG TPA: hypothetical protein VKE51_14910 [Vicinamibacterales bacterium]|nr:hypothetical protein [Vicinamibacterales bacterium]
MAVREAWLIAWIECRPLERHAPDPRLSWCRAAQGELGEERILNIALATFAAQIIFVFACRRHARGQHVPLCDRRLRDQPAVESCRIERFRIRRTGLRQHSPWHCSASPLLPHRAAGREQRASGTIIPKDPRTHNGSRVAGQIRPAAVVDIVPFLPVSAD